MEFIKISYTGKLENGKVFDTTDEDVAKKEGIHDPKRKYSSFPVVVGEGQVIPGLDEALAGMKVGEEKTVEIPPEKAYGKKNPALVGLVPMKKFKEQGIHPVPGMPIDVDGRTARVQTVSGGRVRVDFNHDLAGRALTFDVKVEEKAESDEDKVRFLVDKNFDSTEGFDLSQKGKDISVGIPEDAYRDRNLLIRKASFAAEAFRFLEAENVTFSEVWKNPKDKK